MPHVILKVWPGKTEEQKIRATELIVRDLMEAFGSKEDSISVSIEEFHPDDWSEQVYTPDILNKSSTLYKKPGY